MNELSPDKYGICDGNCLCGTCHVRVNPDDFEKLKAKEEGEIDLLKTLDVKIDKYSRLGCQIKLKKEYDNITISIV
jgi:2Fe-2S ferredoxin